MIRTVQGFHRIRLVIIRISPAKLGRGGRAMLAAEAKSHQIVERGVRSFNPRLRAKVRVEVRS